MDRVQLTEGLVDVFLIDVKIFPFYQGCGEEVAVAIRVITNDYFHYRSFFFDNLSLNLV